VDNEDERKWREWAISEVGEVPRRRRWQWIEGRWLHAHTPEWGPTSGTKAVLCWNRHSGVHIWHQCTWFLAYHCHEYWQTWWTLSSAFSYSNREWTEDKYPKLSYFSRILSQTPHFIVAQNLLTSFAPVVPGIWCQQSDSLLWHKWCRQPSIHKSYHVADAVIKFNTLCKSRKAALLYVTPTSNSYVSDSGFKEFSEALNQLHWTFEAGRQILKASSSHFGIGCTMNTSTSQSPLSAALQKHHINVCFKCGSSSHSKQDCTKSDVHCTRCGSRSHVDAMYPLWHCWTLSRQPQTTSTLAQSSHFRTWHDFSPDLNNSYIYASLTFYFTRWLSRWRFSWWWSWVICTSIVQMKLTPTNFNYFYINRGCEVFRWVCLSVCVSAWISVEPHAIFTIFLYIAWVRGSVLHILMIDRIAYRQEPGDASAHHGRSVINNCLV